MEQDFQTNKSGYLDKAFVATFVNQKRIHRLINKLRQCFWQSFFLFLVAAVQMLFLAGCVFPPRYPSQLPALVPFDADSGLYPSATGYYLDKGTAFTARGKSKGEVYLSQFLFKHPIPNKDKSRLSQDNIFMLAGPQKVLVSGSPAKDVFEIKFLRNGQESLVLRWSEGPNFMNGFSIEKVLSGYLQE